MEIASSARRHGVADEDIRHAATNPIRVIGLADDRVLYIGGDRSGRLLEVVVIDSEIVIHAMPLRAKFHRHLR